MNLRKAILSWLTKNDNSNKVEAIAEATVGSGYPNKMHRPETFPNTGATTFSVYPAVGGKVIETFTYDYLTDRRTTRLYIITDKEDLGAELGQILTRESLSYSKLVQR
jgi:hypothetical protein